MESQRIPALQAAASANQFPRLAKSSDGRLGDEATALNGPINRVDGRCTRLHLLKR